MRNKKLISRYPFLLPRNAWTGKVVKDYDFTWTDYDCIPKGWRIAFGKLLLEDLRDACLKTNWLDKLQFVQIKEKYASLRMYTNGAPQEVHDVIDKYEFISHFICIDCGSPNACIVNSYGWLLPSCEDCWNKDNKRREGKGWNTLPWEDVIDEERKPLPNEYKATISYKGVEETITHDISDTVNKIRKKYEKKKH